MRYLLGTAAIGMIDAPMHGDLSPQFRIDQPTRKERVEMGRIATEFQKQFNLPALSVAISKNGQILYDRALGNADRKSDLANTANLFRIASLTMPITSVTLFGLIEKGQLNLNDKVFGESGVLGTKYGKPPYKQYVTDITVDDLLTHTCGGWPNDSTDPMFRFDSWDHAQLIAWTLENLPLSYPPGQRWAYSSFGYCVLGRVIEQVTGQTYADYVKSAILQPCGIRDMSIAGNTLQERAPNEVMYYGENNEDPYKINITRMDSDDGWMATPCDLVQFLEHLIGFGNTPSLLKPETIKIMTTPTPAYPESSARKYARGWVVGDNGQGNWWHDGSLPGSTTLMVRTATGLCWAGLTNIRTEPSDEMARGLEQMMWAQAGTVPAWGA